MQHRNIPYLVGATTDGAEVLLVESKFWAQLTPNQPTGYVRRLPTDREGMVLFVAPEGRYEELWRELAARCQREGLELRDETGNRQIGTRRARRRLGPVSKVLRP